MTRTIDLSPLTAPVTRDEIRAWRAQAKASGAKWATLQPGQIVGGVIVAAVLVVFVVIFGGVFTSMFSTLGSQLHSPAGGGLSAFSVGIAVLVLVLVAIGIARATGLVGGKWERWMRLDRYARANGFVFSPRSGRPDYQGAIFGLGSDQHVVEHLRSAEGRFIDIGNYRYTTGSGKQRRTHRWGFMAMQLDRRLPHMMLDSKANNGLFGGTNLPRMFARDQVLSLEGDFDRYFTLYCPREYERDALYVFTPDLMALLIDEASPFDVEIVDDWMFVFVHGGFRSTDPVIHSRMLRIVDTVGTKTLRQTMRYADERVGDRAVDIVAPQGRRLRTGVPVLVIIAVAVFLAIWGTTFFGSILGGLGG